MDKKEIWSRLFADGREIVSLEPWQTLTDGQLIGIRTPDMTEPLYVNILGNAGMTYGIVFYKGSAGLNDFHMLRMAEQLNLEHYLMLQQNCYVMYLGDEDDIPEDQRQLIEETGAYEIDPEADDMPYFLRLEAGYFPWTPNDAHAEELLGFTGLFLDFWKNTEFEEDWDIEDDGRICFAHKEGGEWHSACEEAPFLEYYADFTSPSREEVREVMADCGRRGGDFEADIYCMYTYVTDEEFEYPLASSVVLLADCETGMIMNMELLMPQEENSLAFGRVLLEACEDYGIPDTLYVRSPYFRDMLKELCDELGINIEVSEEMEILDDAEETLETFAGMMADGAGDLPF